MIYTEYIERDRAIPFDVWRYFARQEGWVGEDEKVVNIARTKAIGPWPTVLCCWQVKDIARLDEFEAYFRSDEGLRDVVERATYHAIDFQRAGLHDALLLAPLPDDGLHYVEFFDAGEEMADDAVREHFAGRAKAHGGGALKVLLRRVGLLAPYPGDIAIWTFPDYVAMEPIARERHGGHPLRPRAAGLYRNVGFESI